MHRFAQALVFSGLALFQGGFSDAQEQKTLDGAGPNEEYFIQVGSFLDSRRSSALEKELRGRFELTGVSPALQGMSWIYRVRIGPYQRRQEAEDVSLELQTAGYASWVLRESPSAVAARAPAEAFYIQVGVFRKPRNAMSSHYDLRVRSWNASIRPAVSEGIALYRVLVGPYPDKTLADKAARILQGSGYPTAVFKEQL